jgi:hypothetical protein
MVVVIIVVVEIIRIIVVVIVVGGGSDSSGKPSHLFGIFEGIGSLMPLQGCSGCLPRSPGGALCLVYGQVAHLHGTLVRVAVHPLRMRSSVSCRAMWGGDRHPTRS